MDIGRPFIRLPFAFDARRLAQEAQALPESCWMPHPSGMQGNSAVPLISRGGGANDEFDGAMALTPHLRQCRYTQQVVASFGEVLGRSRFMRLDAGAEVSVHVDFNYHWLTRVRIHIPVVTDPAVTFHCAQSQMHMAAGECWIFNSWRRHRVVNASSLSRIHLVLDAAGSSRFWRLVREMRDLHERERSEAIASRIKHIGYDREWQGKIQTERFNTAPVMAPGEVDGLVESLVSDFSAHRANDSGLVARYQVLLEDFCKDWREAWHLYGYSEQGRPRYQSIIDALQSELHPNPRALVTASNQIGVNPIIVQRILTPALCAANAAPSRKT